MVNIKLLFIILDNGYSKKINYILNKYKIKFKTVSNASGTASPSLLSYFGLTDTKKEIYIGLIRSITHDFKLKQFNLYQINLINDYWYKYCSLAKEQEFNKYQSKITTINKDYWSNYLKEITNNFNAQIIGKKIHIIEKAYQNYLQYADNKNDLISFKYQEYLSEYKKLLNEKKHNLKRIMKIISFTASIIFITIILFLLFENTKKLTNEINLSLINKHCYQLSQDYQYFEKYFKKTVSDLKITDIKLNNEDKSVDITITLKNILIKKNKTYTFKVNDDMGPVITPIACSFNDTETVDVYKCFSVYDFTDGEINKENIVINQDKIDFKKDGTKTINVQAKDNDGNENNLDINIIITKTPIEIEFNINDKLIVGNTNNTSYKITPNNISDTSVFYTYDQNLLTITNGKIKVLKKGQTEICAIANYNQEVKQCKTVNLELQCKNSYTFTFDGSKEEIITAGENFCTGTYKIYASVMNKNNFYHLKIRPKDAFSGETLTIYKNSSFLNDEGSKYVLTDGYTITTEIGITSVKLVK